MWNFLWMWAFLISIVLLFCFIIPPLIFVLNAWTAYWGF